MRIYHVDITIPLSVPAYNEDEAKQVCLEQFRKGAYNKDEVVVTSKEV